MERSEVSSRRGPLGVSVKRAQEIGEELKQAREAQGIELRAMGLRIRIREHFLLAMERGQWEVLPQGLNGRGLIRLYAKELGIIVDDLEPKITSNAEKELQGQYQIESHGRTIARSEYRPDPKESHGDIVTPDLEGVLGISKDELDEGEEAAPGEGSHKETDSRQPPRSQFAPSAPKSTVETDKSADNEIEQLMDGVKAGTDDASDHHGSQAGGTAQTEESQAPFSQPETVVAQNSILGSAPLTSSPLRQLEKEYSRVKSRRIRFWSVTLFCVFSVTFLSIALWKKGYLKGVLPLPSELAGGGVPDSPMKRDVILDDSGDRQAGEAEETTAEENVADPAGTPDASPDETALDGNDLEKAVSDAEVDPEADKEEAQEAAAADPSQATLKVLEKVSMTIRADGEVVFDGVHDVGTLPLKFKKRAVILVRDGSKVDLTVGQWHHGVLGTPGRVRRLVIHPQPYKAKNSQ